MRVWRYARLSRDLVTRAQDYGFVHTIDTSAILGNGVLHTFLINRNEDESATVEIIPGGFHLKSIHSAELVTGTSSKACNTFDKPDTIKNRPFKNILLEDGNATVQLPPLSIAAISFVM